MSCLNTISYQCLVLLCIYLLCSSYYFYNVSFYLQMLRSYCFVISVFCLYIFVLLFFFFMQKTAYEMRISDWSSDVCSSDLPMLFSAAFHMTGVTDAKPPVELINAAQVVVGTTIGCRFAGVKMALVARSIVASIGSTIILVSTGMLCAVLFHTLTGLPTIGLFLPFDPAGLAEIPLTDLALARTSVGWGERVTVRV